MIKPGNLIMVYLLLLLCTSCGEEQADMPMQQWRDLSIIVQSRPPTVVEGMNEFLVIVSRDKRPASDLIVSIKIKGRSKWHQSIQDGHVGAYRKAVSVGNTQTDVLLVHIRQEEGGTVLEFPLNQQTLESAGTK